eukprot:TRINITY_DN12_c0_g1_i2.p1 TRINITY_DN12_c0_g1~~TRINITY_DN12_c0_g1_i2.p1  ORF type:complete len:309 (-),score=50.12 TRINITY_DN12_c0_g1_i2:18-944(-)
MSSGSPKVLKPLNPVPTQEQRDSRKLKKPKVPPKYEEQKPFTKADFDEFVKLCYNTGSEWNKEFEKPNLTVWILKSKDTDIKSVRLRRVFKDVDADTLYDVLHDHEYRECWDENMVDGYPIELLNKTNEIGYYAGRMPKGISNRDFCNKRGWQRRKSEGLWIVINNSVQHPNCPEYKGFIRGWSFRTGYLIKKLDEGVEFYYCTRSDPKGWIPAWAVNWVMTKFTPKMLDKVHAAVGKYKDWKKNSHSKDYKPWLDDEQKDPEARMTKEMLKDFRAKEVYVPSKKGWDHVVEDDEESKEAESLKEKKK